MERVTILKDYGNDLYLIAVSGRCAWTTEAQIRFAKKRPSYAGIVYEPEEMPQELYTSLLGAGFNNLCKY